MKRKALEACEVGRGGLRQPLGSPAPISSRGSSPFDRHELAMAAGQGQMAWGSYPFNGVPLRSKMHASARALFATAHVPHRGGTEVAVANSGQDRFAVPQSFRSPA